MGALGGSPPTTTEAVTAVGMSATTMVTKTDMFHGIARAVRPVQPVATVACGKGRAGSATASGVAETGNGAVATVLRAVATAAVVVGMMSATAHGTAAEAEAAQGWTDVMIITAGATIGGAMAVADGPRKPEVQPASVATLSPVRIGEQKSRHNVCYARV
mmetsp:Transcript_37074/g.118139  ORF Transcript_37074/g.118139 Transcript_37074/m.118139 type:complete len:160 (-) Transcript_37074:339-818(-)